MLSFQYPDTLLFLDGRWTPAAQERTIAVLNPATNEEIGRVAQAGSADLDIALNAAARGFECWRKISAFERYKVMRKAAEIIRLRAPYIARCLTLEQGKPLAESFLETANCADLIDWFAEEGRRAYGWVIPARNPDVQQLAIKEPVGPVAAFTPWNFPLNQAVRKISAALAAGCSIIVKAPEETPAAPAELVRAFADAGVPAGTLGLVYGDPAEISAHLIPHPIVRKITFTGSTSVGKHLAALAGTHMKRATMELGGHAPAIIFDDADIDAAARQLAQFKFRNAGQVCTSPSRFLIQERVYEQFVERFVNYAEMLKVGDGMTADTSMGPLANERRVMAVEALISDATSKGGKIRTGGSRLSNKGNFFAPTVISDATIDMRAMNEEPFGPLAMVMPFRDLDDAAKEANRLPYGLASFAFTRSLRNAHAISAAVEAGMMTINHIGLAFAEVPFGGVKDSGYGSEGGMEAMQPYLNTKFVTLMPA